MKKIATVVLIGIGLLHGYMQAAPERVQPAGSLVVKMKQQKIPTHLPNGAILGDVDNEEFLLVVTSNGVPFTVRCPEGTSSQDPVVAAAIASKKAKVKAAEDNAKLKNLSDKQKIDILWDWFSLGMTNTIGKVK